MSYGLKVQRFKLAASVKIKRRPDEGKPLDGNLGISAYAACSSMVNGL